ncbi:amidohydrolase, partial [Archaeoglobus sp.]
VRSIDELKRRLKEHAEKTESEWIVGYGWDQELLKRYPTRWDLDEVVDDRPVLLSRFCLHAGVLNTKAMEICNLLDSESPCVMRNERGATGVVVENAYTTAVNKFRESLKPEDYEKFIESAMRYVLSHGITAVGFVSCGSKSFKALERLRAKRKLKLRVFVYLKDSEITRFGISRGFGDEFLKINGVKIIADGSLGARTAWLSERYEDGDSCGFPIISRDELEKIARRVHKANLQLAIHGIGDRTIDTILDVYQELNAKIARHRIEHASVLRDDQVERIAKLGIVVSAQPHFIISDWWVVRRVGQNRAKWVYRLKSLIEKGIVVGFGTDAPVESVNPWETVYSAVTRGKHEELELYELTKNENLTVEEALHCYTYGSAYLLFEEQNLGTLEVGKFADFVVVDRDPFDVDERDLRNIKVLETYIGGNRVYP